jgi:hypothetical protein
MEADYQPPIPPLPPELGIKLRFGVHFDRANPVVNADLHPYTVGTHVIATKQMPSALLMRKSGSPTLKKVVEQAQSVGIPVVCKRLNGNFESKVLEFAVSPDDVDQVNVSEVSLDATNMVVSRDLDTFESKRAGVPYPQGKNWSYTVSYENPFNVIAGRFAARETGMAMPKILVWSGDGHSLAEPIPSHLLKNVEGWGGTSGNSIHFTKIQGAHIKYDFLMKQTYWGRMLMRLTRNPVKTKGGETLYAENTLPVRQWARVLSSRILALLQGGPDPIWDQDRTIWADQDPRPEKHRAIRFLELLKTVDGLFLQCLAAVPEEKWTWEKFDMFTLKNLSSMIGDEFFDGDLAVEYHNTVSRFSQLKKARKIFKAGSNMAILDKLLKDRKGRRSLLPDWLGFWLPRWEYTRGYKSPFQLAHADSVLSQTRGAGQPPDLVKMQSKRKFLETVSSEPAPLSQVEKATILAALRQLDEDVPQEVFTGLDTKARVTLNANACWEHNQQEGGTLDAIAEIVTDAAVGKPCRVRDLFTGKITSEKRLDDPDMTAGTYVFWRCLDEVLKMPPPEIRMAALVMISEPGKGRTVTKASAALKVVLDVVNKICSYPLSKIESSKSGMGKASHAWNSFKSAFTAEGKEYVFNVWKETSEARPDGSRVVTRHYRDLWNSSTDYEEATDSAHHEVARMIGKYWMGKCGIPPILQAVVNGTCFVPRPIVFEAYGSMSTYGDEWNSESPFQNPRFVMLRKGILMGDPLTKVVLHLINILVRITGAKYASPDFVERIFPQGSGAVIDYVERYSKTDPVGALAPTMAPSVEAASISGEPFVKMEIPGMGTISMPKEEAIAQVLEPVQPVTEFTSSTYRDLKFSLTRALYPLGRPSDLAPERDRFLSFESQRLSHALRLIQMEEQRRTLAAQAEAKAENDRKMMQTWRFDSLRVRGRPSRSTQHVSTETPVSVKLAQARQKAAHKARVLAEARKRPAASMSKLFGGNLQTGLDPSCCPF